MATQLQSKSTINIHAPRDKVWEAITRPELVKRYFYGSDLKADWQKGGEIVYSGSWNGKSYEDRGTIIDYEEGESVTMDFPEKYGRVTYILKEHGKESLLRWTNHEHTTTVTVIQDGVENNEERKRSEESWKKVLEDMKEMLEG